ncbi:hypothetical protein COU37_05230 [Candidatus Micrarchaeota archaeon CG10_big_fil_rev_8_21_14_0_10_45_29]|nr:MAG: hypothetical protein COU37_05230 [Candidatus Micrarchaeota archaeon CG10_big_fil_rev_8_21_14_0_10_45_29]
MKLISAAILLNKKKAWARKLEKEAKKLLLHAGVKILPPQNAQILITIGGDGTVLYHNGLYDKPIFAIGSKTSHICNTRHEKWKQALEPIIKNGFYLEGRTMLSSSLDGKRLPDALNEVVVRNRLHRIVDLRLFVGKKKFSFQADGLMFSTATGSRAYAYSCGGAEMDPLSSNCQIVAIAPFRRTFSPLIVKDGVRSKVIVDSTCDAGAVVDGQFELPVKRRCTLEVWQSNKKMHFVRPIK